MVKMYDKLITHSYDGLIAPTMSTKKKPSDQYQIRLTPELRQQILTEAKKDGDSSLASWIKRIVRQELLKRGIEPEN